MANILFLIIDMQNGFINNFTEDLIPKILDFQAKIGDSVLTAGTRYVNHEHTACYIFEGWKSCMAGTKEAEIVPALRGCMAKVFDKDKYSCWNEEMKAFVRENEIEKIYFAGVANSHFLRTAGPHFPDSPGHIKRTAWDISRAEGTPPH